MRHRASRSHTPTTGKSFAVNEAVVADLLAGIEDALPGANSVAVPFQAGLPVPGGAFNPNVSIDASAIPDTASVDELAEVTNRALKLALRVHQASQGGCRR